MESGPPEYPKATDWKNTNIEELKDMLVTIDQARQQIFYQVRKEIEILEKGWADASPSFEKLAGNTYGNKSKLYHTFLEEKLVSSYPAVCRFLATFHV